MVVHKQFACLMLATLFLLSTGVSVVDNASATVPEPEWGSATPLPYPVYLAASVQDDDHHIYIIGGRAGLSAQSYDNVTLYDMGSEQVTELANIPIGVAGGVAAIGPDDRIYVFGGKNLSLAGQYPSAVQIYDPDTDSWSEGADMPTAVTMAEAVTMPNGLIYVISGMNEYVNPLEPLGIVQIYDPTADSWTTGASMSEPRYAGATVAIYENVIMYIGGSNPDIAYSYNSIQYYVVDEGFWYGSMNPFPEKFAGAEALIGPDGLIYLVGGGRGNSAYSTSGVTTRTGFCMDPFSGDYISLPDMDYDRKYHSIGYDDEGYIYVLGGYSFDEPVGESTAQAEKIRVMDLSWQVEPEGVDPLTGEQILVQADFNFAVADYEELTADVRIWNDQELVVASYLLTAYIADGNPGHYRIDVPQDLPSGDYVVEFCSLWPSYYTWDDLSFPGFELSLTFEHGLTVHEQLEEQDQTIGDLQEQVDVLHDDLTEANDKLDAAATNLMIVMILAIITVIVAVVVLVLSLRKKA